MSSWIADYWIVRPLDDGDDPQTLLARAPDRLGGHEVVLYLLDPDPARLTAASAHLLSVAAAHAPHVVDLVEMGQGERDGTIVAYLTTQHRGIPTLAAASSLDADVVLFALAGAAAAPTSFTRPAWSTVTSDPRRCWWSRVAAP